MKTIILVITGIGTVLLLPSLAMAQNQNEISANPVEGVTITSNSDNIAAEFVLIRDSGVDVFYADGDVQTHVSNANNTNILYDTDNNGSGTFSIQTGGSNVLTANNAGTVTIQNSMVTNGINNGNDGISNAGAISGVTTLGTSGLATLNSASVTTTLGVGGLATLNSASVTNALTVGGATTMNNTLSVDTNGGAAGGTRFVVDATAATTTSTDGDTINTLNNNGHVLSHVDGAVTNSVTIADTQTGMIGANSFDYGTTVNGGMFIDGDLGVDGNIYALNPTANSGINVGNNGLDISGANNRTTLVADSNGTTNDGRGAITLEEDEASFYVYNATTGEAHGLSVDQTQTVLSGGTTSTTLTLNDNGATFTNTDTGGPARVRGVSDGVNEYDAVNVRQLRDISRTANAGVASVAAMANIPSPLQGKNFSLGLGYGNFESENAVAFGGGARINDYISVKASFGRSNDNNTVGAGVGVSW